MEWLTGKELAGLPSMNKTADGVRRQAKRENWTTRKKPTGKGLEYHIESLPPETQIAIARLYKEAAKKAEAETKAQTNPTERPQRRIDVEALWEHYAQAGQKQKDEAERRLKALDLLASLQATGLNRKEAIELVRAQHGVTRPSLYRWLDAVKGAHFSDRLALLLPHYAGRTVLAECEDEAWELFRADYLRLEQPTIADCYRRLGRIAAERGWRLPTQATFTNWVKSRIPLTTRVLMREGDNALLRLYPAQERSVAALHAMEWINGDGYQHNVFVKWPDGAIERPKTWFWQDVYSRRILAYRIDVTENTDQIRLAFGDLVEQYGIPAHATIDNTRAAANKWLTGRTPNRYRFKVKEDDPAGLLTKLGVEVHWTSVYAGKGHGQAKPIERAFGVGGLGEAVDKHPAFAGAWTGNNPMTKPENYASKAVDLETFVTTLQQEILAWNARAGRRTEICQGVLSFDAAFNNSYATAPIRRPTEEQRRWWLLAAEAVKVRKDATFSLEAGAQIGGGRNRYYTDQLFDYGEKGKKIVVRFDPSSLHEQVHCYTLDGSYIGPADLFESAGFGDTATARIYNRGRKQFIKATKQAIAAEERMDAAEMAAQLNAGIIGQQHSEQLPAQVANKVTRIARLEKPMELPAIDQQQEQRNEEARNFIKEFQMRKQERKEHAIPEDGEERYYYWLALEQNVLKGEEIPAAVENWFRSYPTTAEFRGFQGTLPLRKSQQG